MTTTNKNNNNTEEVCKECIEKDKENDFMQTELLKLEKENKKLRDDFEEYKIMNDGAEKEIVELQATVDAFDKIIKRNKMT